MSNQGAREVDQLSNPCTVIGPALPAAGDRAHPLIVAKRKFFNFFRILNNQRMPHFAKIENFLISESSDYGEDKGISGS